MESLAPRCSSSRSRASIERADGYYTMPDSLLEKLCYYVTVQNRMTVASIYIYSCMTDPMKLYRRDLHVTSQLIRRR